ncbi:heterokaryon incompatibility protein-domain-containing protein, partial [Clohesyomyces aquaticus]
MRLIDVDSLELKLFNDDELPEYAILSHTWGDGEALENSQKSFTSRPGYQKIFKCAQTAKRLGLRYIWVDTCCIDKTSSAELQEAINSMYRYYKNSSICLVYLCDAKPVEHRFMLASSRWITRGWTLQELIAPRAIEFYAHDWSHLCNKTEWMDELSEVTGIPANILKTCDPSQACIAERMSWASKRSTTRIEDRAYCLLGLFDLQMPMLYGEGEKAFFRLQEGILKTSDDYSIFAW